jgi:hypothetical protein
MPLAGFKLTIPVSGQVKTVHASDCTVTVIGSNNIRRKNKLFIFMTSNFLINLLLHFIIYLNTSFEFCC